MRLRTLLHFAVLALATTAAPLVGQADATDDKLTHDARGPKTRPKSLLPELANFDMQTTFTMAVPPSDGTNVLPDHAMAAFPTALSFEAGSFDPDAVLKAAKDRLAVDPQALARIATVLKATSYTADLVKSPVSGEMGLSHVLYQQLGGPLNAILATLGLGDWSARGKGKSAPIEDWRLIDDTGTRAVLELKTDQALTAAYVKKITSLAAKGQLGMRKLEGQKGKVNSLVSADQSEVPTRIGRGTPVIALEQVLAQMYTTDSRIGVLTNGHDWIVCERKIKTPTTSAAPKRASTTPANTDAKGSRGTKPETIAITTLSGVLANGKSNALNILLAMSLSV